MQTLLVFGVDRVVGGNVIATLSDRFQVAGVSRHAVKIDGCPSRRADLRDPGSVAKLVKKYSPNWVVYAGGLAGSSWDPAETDLEYEPSIAAALLHAVDEVDAQLTYVSTDAVFNGPRMFHAEDSPQIGPAQSISPSLATAALAVEETLRGTSALLVRTHAYGWNPRVDALEYAEKLCQALEDEQPVAVDANQYASPILATDLAELLYQAWQAKLTGVLHLAGGERVSSVQFASQLADVLGTSRRVVGEAPLAVPQPGSETALIAQRARQELGVSMPMLVEGLERFVLQSENGYRERFQIPQDVAYAA